MKKRQFIPFFRKKSVADTAKIRASVTLSDILCVTRHFLNAECSHRDKASIERSSSAEKCVFSIAFIFSVICDGFDAPIRTEVTAPSRRIHASAISASVCPRAFATAASSSYTFKFIFGQRAFLQELPSFLIRLSSGIPFRYLSVSIPCASGLNAIIPRRRFTDSLFSPLFSIVRSNIE